MSGVPYGPNLKLYYTIPVHFCRKSIISYLTPYTTLGASPSISYTHTVIVTNSWNTETVTSLIVGPGGQEGLISGSFSTGTLTAGTHWLLFSVPVSPDTLTSERSALTPSNYMEYASITWGNGDGSAGFSITAT